MEMLRVSNDKTAVTCAKGQGKRQRSPTLQSRSYETLNQNGYGYILFAGLAHFILLLLLFYAAGMAHIRRTSSIQPAVLIMARNKFISLAGQDVFVRDVQEISGRVVVANTASSPSRVLAPPIVPH